MQTRLYCLLPTEKALECRHDTVDYTSNSIFEYNSCRATSGVCHDAMTLQM